MFAELMEILHVGAQYGCVIAGSSVGESLGEETGGLVAYVCINSIVPLAIATPIVIIGAVAYCCYTGDQE